MKDDIVQNNWIAYLKYWLEKKDTTNPPSEDGFWLWYCLEFLDKQKLDAIS